MMYQSAVLPSHLVGVASQGSPSTELKKQGIVYCQLQDMEKRHAYQHDITS